MKKTKLQNILIIIIVGCLIFAFGIIVLIISNRNDTDTKNTLKDEMTELVKRDYMVTNIIYGTPIVNDNIIMTFDEIEYKAIDYKEFKNLSYLYDIIDNTYAGVMNTYYADDVNKYNSYMEIDDNIYVAVNTKCDIGEFDDDIKVSTLNNEIIVKSNNLEVKAIKDKGQYKLEGSFYRCSD